MLKKFSFYREFKQAFEQVGGFYLYPSNPEALEEKIPVMAVSGNHDGWEFNNLEGDYFKKFIGPYDPSKGTIGIPQAAWNEFVSLLNQYPVIGYLSGHVHYTSI